MKFRFALITVILTCTTIATTNAFGFSKEITQTATQKFESHGKRLVDPVVRDAFSSTALPESIVVATGEWAPYTSKKLRHYGFFTEIVSAVFKEMGVTPTYRFYPWKRCQKEVHDGDAWAAFPYTYNKERAKTYAFSDVVASSKTLFFYYKNKMQGVAWKQLKDLRPYRIGGVLGYYYEKEFKKAKLNVEYTNKEVLGLKKMINDRIDLFPMNELVGWDLIKKGFPNKLQNFGTLKRPESESPLGMMVLKGNTRSAEILEQFNNALRRIKEKGIYQKILAEHNVSTE